MTFNLPAPPNFRGLDENLPIRRYERHLPHWRKRPRQPVGKQKLNPLLPVRPFCFPVHFLLSPFGLRIVGGSHDPTWAHDFDGGSRWEASLPVGQDASTVRKEGILSGKIVLALN